LLDGSTEESVPQIQASHPEPFLAPVEAETEAIAPSKQWKLQISDDGASYAIINEANGLSLDGNVTGVKEQHDTQHPSPFLFHPIEQAENQLWIFEPVSNTTIADELAKELEQAIEMSHFSEGELKEFKEVFSTFDLNDDGKISVHELGKALRRIGLNPTNKEVQEMVHSVDLDASGTLDFNEFLLLIATVEWPSQDNSVLEIENAFKHFDTDGNGTISKNELKHMMTTLGEILGEEEVDFFMDLADTNKDGVIDYTEFAKLLSDRV
jgi:calmodulin